MAPTGQQYDSKSGQWLGSTIGSSGEDGTILVLDHSTSFLAIITSIILTTISVTYIPITTSFINTISVATIAFTIIIIDTISLTTITLGSYHSSLSPHPGTHTPPPSHPPPPCLWAVFFLPLVPL